MPAPSWTTSPSGSSPAPRTRTPRPTNCSPRTRTEDCVLVGSDRTPRRGDPMSIATGPVIQLCWVTEDVEATETFLSAHFGVPAWTRLPDIHFDPENCTLHGEPADFTVHVSLGYIGDLQLEIIQPV